jgi:hypothetical protein
MINGLITFASYSYFEGGEIGDLLNYWEQVGFFSYLLPFLLIFALIFGILTQIKIFRDNKAVNGIIALVVGLMALQFDIVPVFFSEVFPKLGVGLAIMLIIIILGGLFMDPDSNGTNYTMLGIGMIIVIVILVNTAGSVGWYAGYWWQDNWPLVAGVVFILIVVAIIIGGSNKTSSNTNRSPWAEALRNAMTGNGR